MGKDSIGGGHEGHLGNPIEIGVYLLAFLLYKACIAGLALACWVWLLDIIKGG